MRLSGLCTIVQSPGYEIRRHSILKEVILQKEIDSNATEKLADEVLQGFKEDTFGKKLFRGLFDTSKIFPFPEPLDQEEESYVQTIKAFADSSIDPVFIDRQSSIPQSLINQLGDLGVLSMSIPKEYGGKGLSQRAYCKVMEVIAARCASTALFINAHQSVGMKALLLFGTEEQKRKWLPELSKGRSLAAFSLTEPNAGSDAAGIETQAVFDPVKDCYSITGRKQWTTNGSIASLLTVMAKTEVLTPNGMEKKITAFLATPDMGGFKVLNPALDKVGMRGSVTSNLAFDQMEVPAKNILGPIGGGLKVCLTVLDYGRTTFGATCTGVAKELVSKAFDHAIHRIQFKRPLASFALVKRKLADMKAFTYAMESATYMTAGLLDRGVEDVMVESAILKVFTSESLWNILYDTMQIYGGRSFFTDAPFERIMRDARLNMIGEGSNEVLRVFIGGVGLREAGLKFKKGVNSFSSLPSFFRSLKPLLIRASIPFHCNELEKEVVVLEKLVRLLAKTTFKALIKYREKVIEQQQLVNRLAEGAIAIYTITAVVSRLATDIREKKLNQDDLEIGRYYVACAYQKAVRHLSSLERDEESQAEALTDRLLQNE